MSRKFKIRIDFQGKLSKRYADVFHKAARRWEEIIVAPKRGSPLVLTIGAVVRRIDGPGSVLGRAGPTQLRVTDNLPLEGAMEFDADDLDTMEANGTLEAVILHEMAHVLGIGTLWERKGLLRVENPRDPRYIGRFATREYSELKGKNTNSIPVANTGGPGTAGGHWRESVFDYELMTGYTEDGDTEMPISSMTVAALEDLGYTVDYSKADYYFLPNRTLVNGMAIKTGRKNQYCLAEFPPAGVERYPLKSKCFCC